MKKLAFALMCLVSVAFFASCNPNVENPEPSIAFYVADGYISANAEINAGDTNVMFGLQANSNTETLKLLKSFSFQITADSTVYEFTENDINRMSYSYDVRYIFENEGTYTVKATVVDAAEETASVTITVTVIANLEETPFTWERVAGAPGTGLEEFGLQWTGNVKDIIHAVIKPLEGATLYQFNAELWESVTTMANKVALFAADTIQPIVDFREISAEATHDYDFMIGTIYNEEYHLMHITHATVEHDPINGTTITITGDAK